MGLSTKDMVEGKELLGPCSKAAEVPRRRPATGSLSKQTLGLIVPCPQGFWFNVLGREYKSFHFWQVQVMHASEDPLFYHWGLHFAPGTLASLPSSQRLRLTLVPGPLHFFWYQQESSLHLFSYLFQGHFTRKMFSDHLSFIFYFISLFILQRGMEGSFVFYFYFFIVVTQFLNAGNHSNLWPFLFKISNSSCSPSSSCPLPRPSPVLFFSVVLITFWQTMWLIYLSVYVLSVLPTRAGIYVWFCLMLTLPSLE